MDGTGDHQVKWDVSLRKTNITYFHSYVESRPYIIHTYKYTHIYIHIYIYIYDMNVKGILFGEGNQ
jgi:hypothetical protein